MEIKHIGYKLTFFGDRMDYYKITKDNKEYLVVDIAGGMFLDMLWTEENEFVNADFNNEEQKEIKDLFKTIPHNDTLLETDNGEEDHFTKHEIKEPEPIPVNPRDDNKYSADEFNEILQVFNEFDFTYDGKGTIDNEMFEYANEEGFTPDLFKKLIGYKVKVKTDGSHKNDGQMVRYKFTFKSPSGVKTKIYTNMCLMVGWNYHEDVIIN